MAGKFISAPDPGEKLGNTRKARVVEKQLKLGVANEEKKGKEEESYPYNSLYTPKGYTCMFLLMSALNLPDSLVYFAN